MKRFDLRGLKDNFYIRLGEIIDNELLVDEVAIVMFEIINFNDIEKSANFIKEHKATLMNSLRFNEVDWTLVIKKNALNIDED